MRFNRIIIVSLLVLAVTTGFSAARKSGGGGGGFTGGYTPIENITDPHVTEIANFAVEEYDKRSGAKLKLVRVLQGESQVVAGTNYRLVLAAKDGSATNKYEAVVWEKVWVHFRNLTSFKPLH